MMITWVLVMILGFHGHDALQGNIAVADTQSLIKKSLDSRMSPEAPAAPQVCERLTCGHWRTYGLTYGRFCVVTDENWVITLPAYLVPNEQECEHLSSHFEQSHWYNYRQSGACELLSFCEETQSEVGSVTGPDPGEGQTCFVQVTPTQSTTTESPATTPTTTVTTTTTARQKEALLMIGGGVVPMVDAITEDLEFISGVIPDYERLIERFVSAVFIDNQVVVCGFRERSCLHVNWISRTWDGISDLEQRRAQHAHVVYNGTMYVIGGIANYNTPLSSVERYDKVSNSWVNVPEWSLPQNIQNFCAVVHDEYIYIIGGYYSLENWRLSTITNTYETIAPNHQVRFSNNACVKTSIEGEEGIVVAGGNWLKSTEFYSFASNTWRNLAELNTNVRARHGIGVLNGQVVVFGGVDDTGFVDSLEVYNSTADEWTLIQGPEVVRNNFAYVKVPW